MTGGAQGMTQEQCKRLEAAKKGGIGVGPFVGEGKSPTKRVSRNFGAEIVVHIGDKERVRTLWQRRYRVHGRVIMQQVKSAEEDGERRARTLKLSNLTNCPLTAPVSQLQLLPLRQSEIFANCEAGLRGIVPEDARKEP